MSRRAPLLLCVLDGFGEAAPGPGNAIDPAEAYRRFRGRDATIEPLMRDRGFPVPASAGN